jgi:hypothetical protein
LRIFQFVDSGGGHEYNASTFTPSLMNSNTTPTNSNQKKARMVVTMTEDAWARPVAEFAAFDDWFRHVGDYF